MELSITPKKSLGQNFLINPRILDKIIAAAEITKEDIVLEVGPGTGNLTKKLAEKAEKVIAVEKDRRLIRFLKDRLSENSAIAGKSEIIESDVLKLNIGDLKITEDYKIVGNIPYYITGKLFKIIFEKWLYPPNFSEKKVRRARPKLIVLTIQKEVAQRIMAKPPKMNLLALSVQFYSDPKIMGYISKENFRPRPKVDSAIVKLAPKEKLPTDDPEKFFKVIRAGFSQKRKLLASNLEKLDFKKNELTPILERFKINPKARAENLDIKDWIALIEAL